jgi:hypothetical protein
MIKITLNKTSVIPFLPFSFRRLENSAWERNHPCGTVKLQKRKDIDNSIFHIKKIKILT